MTPAQEDGSRANFPYTLPGLVSRNRPGFHFPAPLFPPPFYPFSEDRLTDRDYYTASCSPEHGAGGLRPNRRHFGSSFPGDSANVKDLLTTVELSCSTEAGAAAIGMVSGGRSR